MTFSQRSYQKELLDRSDIPFEDIRQNMEELDFINRKLGGHSITLAGLRSLLQQLGHRGAPGTEISVCEIGCGGGDNLRVIRDYLAKKKLHAELGGYDINPHCIEFAKSREVNHSIQFFASDYRAIQFDKKPDIIFCSLFCHHFTDREVEDIFSWMKQHAAKGLFISDLHRNPFAYYSIKWLTRLFSRSYLVKNDACLSVLRGFRGRELKEFAERGGLSGCSIRWKWAFRWLVVYSHA